MFSSLERLLAWGPRLLQLECCNSLRSICEFQFKSCSFLSFRSYAKILQRSRKGLAKASQRYPQKKMFSGHCVFFWNSATRRRLRTSPFSTCNGKIITRRFSARNRKMIAQLNYKVVARVLQTLYSVVPIFGPGRRPGKGILFGGWSDGRFQFLVVARKNSQPASCAGCEFE